MSLRKTISFTRSGKGWQHKEVFFLVVLIVFHYTSNAQELEPRALTNVPVDMNFAVLGYGYAVGNILLDPSVPIEDLNAKLHTVAGAYLRSINFFGLAGKVDAVLPFATGHWEGIYEGIDTTTSRTGTGDLRVRLSVNFVGAPALQAADFKDYKPTTIVGASLQIIVPTGQYYEDRLINLGSNRWVFRPQVGLSRTAGKWIMEGYISAWIFTDNNAFWDGNKLEQRVLMAGKVHFIRSLPRKSWVAFDAGYGFGGTSIINDEVRDTRISTVRLGVTLAVPVATHHTLRLTGVSGIRIEQGADFDAVALSYQYRWGGVKSKADKD